MGQLEVSKKERKSSFTSNDGKGFIEELEGKLLFEMEIEAALKSE